MLNLDLQHGAKDDERRVARLILERNIEEGLHEVLGREGSDMIAKLLPIDLAAADPRKLHELLVSIFKLEGALVIERNIAGRLLEGLRQDVRPKTRKAPRPLKNGQSQRSGAANAELEYEANLLRHFAQVAVLPGARPKNLMGSLDSTALRFAESLTS